MAITGPANPKSYGGIGSSALTLDSTPVEGALMVVQFSCQGVSGGTKPTSLTAPSGFSVALESEGDAAQVARPEWQAVYYKIAGASESTSIAAVGINGGSGDIKRVQAYNEYQGLDESTPLDVTVAFTDNTSTVSTVSIPTTGTLAQADELLIGSTVRSNDTTVSGTGWASLSTPATYNFQVAGVGADQSTTIGYLVVSSTSAVQEDFEATGGNFYQIGMMATFKQAGGASGAGTTLSTLHRAQLRHALTR